MVQENFSEDSILELADRLYKEKKAKGKDDLIKWINLINLPINKLNWFHPLICSFLFSASLQPATSAREQSLPISFKNADRC